MVGRFVKTDSLESTLSFVEALNSNKFIIVRRIKRIQKRFQLSHSYKEAHEFSSKVH